jgi:hypothetical protein
MFQYLVFFLDNFLKIVSYSRGGTLTLTTFFLKFKVKVTPLSYSFFFYFGLQFFNNLALLAKFFGFCLWIITVIDFYTGVPVGVRYLMCLFPNTGLVFCIEVLQQYERKSGKFIFS